MIRVLTSNFRVNRQAYSNISGNIPRSFGDKHKIIAIHQMIEIVRKSWIETRNYVQSQSIIKQGKVLGHENKQIGRQRISLSNPTKSFNKSGGLAIDQEHTQRSINTKTWIQAKQIVGKFILDSVARITFQLMVSF